VDWQGWYTIGIVALTLGAMIRGVAGPDLIMMAGLFALAGVGVLTPAETFAGFANEALWAVGVLFIVSAGLRGTGALEPLVERFFGRAHNERSGLARMTPPIAALSAFLNNAPIVAMMTPTVIDWARRNGMSASKFLAPISYATILGSSTTLIGTSVNLTTAGLLLDSGMEPMGFFELLPVGLGVSLVGLLYLVFVAPLLLPDRKRPGEVVGETRREYTATMRVEPNCPLVGQSVEEAGLRHLEGLFLVEIDRDGHIITPVSPDQPIQANDRLVFAGVVATIVELQRIRGLVPDTGEEDDSAPQRRRLVEAVVSPSSPLVNRTIRQANFRTVYDAAVVAVHRNGKRVPGKIGEIELEVGDTLLLQTSPDFFSAHRNSPDFYLVSEVGDHAEPRYDKAWIAVAILVVMVATAASGLLPIAIAAPLAAGALIGTRCINGATARQAVDLPVLIVIGAGLGIAFAMDKTGAARTLAHVLVAAVGDLGPMATLVAIYAVTVLMAETLHHNAAVAIMFPIAVAAAHEVNADPRGFLMAITIGSAMAFANPVTYQTHLIVYGPGGYRFTDFVKVGLPLDLLCGVTTLAIVPRIWPF
jgi:di/tricarboxylate transporter